jgi:hypothetical protein
MRMPDNGDVVDRDQLDAVRRQDQTLFPES